MKLKDKVAIVTGSSRGIGRTTALLFAQEGAKVVINYKTHKKEAEEVLEKIGKEKSIVVQADVSKENEVKNLIKEAVNKFGRIDILVNNAGEIIRPGDWQMDEKTWDETIAVDLKGAWLMTRWTADIMKKQGKGVVINITSIYGFLGAAPVLAYTSAKGGLITMTKSFAKELAPEVRVNAIAPGNIDTDMTKGAGEELINYFLSQTPLKG